MNENDIIFKPDIFPLKAYVNKDPSYNGYQIFPIPEDIENWYEIELKEHVKRIKQKKFDVETMSFVTCPIKEKEYIRNKRKEAYTERSDPLYKEWQYDQTPEAEQAWRNEVAAIKAEYPLPKEE